MKRVMDSYKGQAGRYDSSLDRARRFRWRIRTLYTLFAGCILLLAGRAANLMVDPPERLERRVTSQHSRPVELSPYRGLIVDRNGRQLAMSVDAYSVVADPQEVKGDIDLKSPEGKQLAYERVRAAALALAPVLDMSPQELREKLGRKGRFSWIKRQVSDTEAQGVRALQIRGVLLRKEKRRAYPNRDLAASILGFVNIDGRGLEGLEAAWNEHLTGDTFSYTRFRDGKGRDVTSDGVLLRQARGGGHLALTLDLGLQAIAEDALQKGMLRSQSKGGLVLVMDPHTGEVLANAQAPGFNPNSYGKADRAAFRNRLVTDVFEPGSTMKPIVIAAAIEEGLTHPDDIYDCENGAYRVARSTIHDTHNYDLISLREVMKVSSNIGTAKVGELLGKTKLHAWLKDFGFGDRTGSGFPGEVGGILRSPERWSRVALATHSFGQGMSVTGLQMAQSYSVLANGGALMRPWLVREVLDEVGHVIDLGRPERLRRVLSEKTARTVTEMMVAVTAPDGTAPLASVPGYRVAGKTGTAQKVDPALKRYGKGMYVSSFAGYLPADDPELVIVVVLDEPQGRHYYGGIVAGPIFRDVALASMQYLGIPPTEPIVPVTNEVKWLAQAVGVRLQGGADDDPLATEAFLKPSEVRPRLTLSLPDVPALSPEEVVVEDGAGGKDAGADKDALAEGGSAEAVEGSAAAWIMPDFTGQPVREVLRALHGYDFELMVTGHGRAAAQVPLAGVAVEPGETIRIVFTPDPSRVAQLPEGVGG